MAALTPSDQNSAILVGSNAQKLELLPSRALDARVAGAAQRLISPMPRQCSLEPVVSIEKSYMAEEIIAFLGAEFGVDSIREEETLGYRKPSSEEQSFELAYEGVAASSGSAAAAQAEEYRYPKESYSEEWSSDLADIDGLLKEMERVVIDREREVRIAKARQLEQSRQSEPIPLKRLSRLRVEPISPLVPIAIRKVFKGTSFNGLSLVPAPFIHPPEMVFGNWQPSKLLRIRHKIR